MDSETDRQIRQIEETQAALRQTISETKELAERTRKLLQKHRNQGDEPR